VGSPTTTTLIVNATELQKLYQRQSKGRVVKQHLGKICSFFDPSVFFLFLLGGGGLWCFYFCENLRFESHGRGGGSIALWTIIAWIMTFVIGAGEFGYMS
jgi:hypothetical protein